MGSLLWSPRLHCQDLELCLFPNKGLIQAFQMSLFKAEYGSFKQAEISVRMGNEAQATNSYETSLFELTGLGAAATL